GRCIRAFASVVMDLRFLRAVSFARTCYSPSPAYASASSFTPTRRMLSERDCDWSGQGRRRRADWLFRLGNAWQIPINSVRRYSAMCRPTGCVETTAQSGKGAHFSHHARGQRYVDAEARIALREWKQIGSRLHPDWESRSHRSANRTNGPD